MTPTPVIQTLLSRLQTPQQDLVHLSFCSGSKDSHVKSWVESLPLTQINHASTQFYRALPEVARLQTRPDVRLAMLDSLRLPVQQSIQGLSQSFLNQPLILPEAARKTATIAQALQKHMSNGYLVVIRELCTEHGAPTAENSALKALVIHRAITGLGLLLLRSYQLYSPVSAQLWAELHTLYLLAENMHLLDTPVNDPLPYHHNVNTIAQAYMRVLLLACARPNQLRQDEVSATYYALENLSTLGQLLPYNTERKDNLFAVLLNSSEPPIYKSRLPGSAQNVLELNTSQLASKLAEHTRQSASGVDSDSFHTSLGLSSALLDHLIQAWNILAQRSFERRPAVGLLDITVGLSNIHYHSADGISFNVFLHQNNPTSHDKDDGKIFQKRGTQLKPSTSTPIEDDPWGDVFDTGGNALAGGHLPTINIELSIRQQQQQSYQGKHPIYKILLVDTSPGGYCLEWQEKIPSQVKAGELIGLREEGRQKWSVGVVRWVQQTQGATQLGIQVIAPHATPMGIAIVHKTGGFSEYLRALQLPALKAVNQPATLLTNAVSFREYNKVRLYSSGDHAHESHESTVQLTQRLFSTGAFSQFTFRELASNKPTDAGADDFDSVWKK
jgi:hypothetical protein